MSGVGLLVGTYTGLGRAGGAHRFVAADVHGLLMVLGFLGLLIALERAITIGTRAAYLAPTMTAVATLALATPLPRIMGGLLLTAAGTLVTVSYVRDLRSPSTAAVLLSSGAAAWAAGAALWTGGSGPILITPLLAAVLVLTILGFRLRDGRLGLPDRAVYRRLMFTPTAVFAAGVAITPITRPLGLVIAGIGLLAQVPWLLWWDASRTELRLGGLTSFAARSTLAAYVWLGVSGAFWIAIGLGATGALFHDALVHALFLGFVLSWLMGHAPSFVPALVGSGPVDLPIRYLPLALLQLSVALRIGADLAGSYPWREIALHGNVMALFAFAFIEFVAARRGRRLVQRRALA